MPQRAEDRWFVTFQATGQPEALGQVFDLCAQRLLIVALHLTREVADAEDMVQATFVTAIESAARYDPAQPLLRWLAGILANHARMAHRRAARSLDADRVPRPAEPAAPVDAAELGETVVAVTDALEALPESYRLVLTLRLLHGLEPQQIAHALQRPPETVRTQLRRGLEQLRQALPQGLAAPGLVLAGAPGRGLAVVRVAVLGKVSAAGVAGVGAATVVGGGLLVANKLGWGIGAAALALVLAGAGWWALTAVPADGEAVVASPASRTDRSELPTTRPTTREAVADARGAMAEVRGAGIAEETGQPLADCTIAVYGWPGQPAPARADAAGRFAFAFSPPAEADVLVSLRAPGRIDRDGRLGRVTRGQVIDVGTIPLATATLVRGQVVDTDGRPVRQVLLRVQVESRGGGGEAFRGLGWSDGRSDGDGSFTLDHPLPCGRHELEVTSHALVSSPEFQCPAGVAAIDLRVVVWKPEDQPRLSGVVVDENGRPVRGIMVSAGNSQGVVSTDERGAFRITATGRVEPVRLLLYGEAGLLQRTPDANTRFAWGSHDIRIQIRRPPGPGSVILNVVRWPEGTALEEFGVLVEPNRAGTGSFTGVRQLPRAVRKDGRLQLEHLTSTEHMGVVIPGDEQLLPAAPILFTPGADAVTQVRVEVRPRVRFPIRIVRRDGTPVADNEVQLLHPLNQRPITQETLTMTLAGGKVYSPALALLRGEARTDAEGCVAFEAPLGQRGLVLRIRPQGCVGLIQEDVEITQRCEPWVITVAGGARVTGRVVPADLATRLLREPAAPRNHPGMSVRAAIVATAPGETLGSRPLPKFDIDPLGAFRLAPLPAGTWELRLCWQPPPTEAGGGAYSGSTWISPPLATVALVDGASQPVELDARAFVPGRLSGRILLDGQPALDLPWALSPVDDADTVQVGGGRTDPEGRFTAEALLPGRYRLSVEVGGRASSVGLFAPEILSVAAGAEVDHTFRITRSALVVRLAASDGQEVAGRTLRWSAKIGNRFLAHHYGGAARTGEDGRARFDPAPPPTAVFFLREPETSDEEWQKLDPAEAARRTLELGPVEPAAIEGELRAEFRLPAPRGR